MPAVIIKTKQAWLDQANKANEAMQARMEKLGKPITLNEFAETDYEQFCLLIEAMHALGAKVSQELMNKAQMRPVDEVLGLPTE